jgi:hypothetical protein
MHAGQAGASGCAQGVCRPAAGPDVGRTTTASLQVIGWCLPNRQQNPALAGSARLMYIALFGADEGSRWAQHCVAPVCWSCAERWPKLGFDQQASLLYCVPLLPGGTDEVRAPEADLERGDAPALPAGHTLPPSCSATRQPCWAAPACHADAVPTAAARHPPVEMQWVGCVGSRRARAREQWN